MLARISSVPMALGKTCLRKTRSGLAPMARAASTNSCALVRRMSPRKKRAYPAQRINASASITVVRPLPKITETIITKTRPGKESITSVMRMIRLSTVPPMNPERPPTTMPMARLMPTTRKPT